MTPIRTDRLILRNWQDDDRDLFFRINSDDSVMEFFPFRRDRAQANAKMDELRAAIEHYGFGFAAIEEVASGETAGFAGITYTDHIPSVPAGTVEIGWRLAPEFWGKGIASEAAKAWLAFGFEKLDLPEIVSFAVKGNRRSIAVMERIGMHAVPERDFDHPGVPDSHPQLKRHVFHRLARADWHA